MPCDHDRVSSCWLLYTYQDFVVRHVNLWCGKLRPAEIREHMGGEVVEK